MPKVSRKREWEDDYTLLCERCGYILEGLDTTTPCPECAKPIAESLPQRRIGTPWQQKPGFVSMVKTWWMTLRHPKRTTSILKDSTRSQSLHLAILTIFSATIVSAVGYAVPELVRLESSFISNLSEFLYEFLNFFMIPLWLFCVLTAIETLGLWIFSKSRGRKLTKNLAIAITAHGCIGWVFVSGLYTLTNLVGSIVFEHMTRLPDDLTSAEYLEAINNSPVPRVGRVVVIANLLSLVPGFLFFEIFAYLGLRRCKYANRIRPNEKQDPSPGLAAESVESNESE